jgi:hypothetical protein
MLYNWGSMWPSVVVHRHARFDWSHDHLGWTIRTWRRVHWSDQSHFFATPYRQSFKGLAPTKHYIPGQPHFGHNCFWGCLGLFFLWLLRSWWWLISRPIKSHTCSIGFMSDDIASHGIVWTASCCKKCCTIRALCGLALLSMNIKHDEACYRTSQ